MGNLTTSERMAVYSARMTHILQGVKMTPAQANGFAQGYNTVLTGTTPPPTGMQAPTAPDLEYTFLPSYADVPADLTALKALGALGQTTAWTAGQFCTLDDASKASWNGTTFVAGAVPAAEGGATGMVAPTGTGKAYQFTPSGVARPANLGALNALGTLGQTDPWAAGTYVTLGDSSKAHWDGYAFVEGIAPTV